MVKVDISEDSIQLLENDGVVLQLDALGGPEDNLRFTSCTTDYEVDRNSLDLITQSIINFMNTGYFNQEG